MGTRLVIILDELSVASASCKAHSDSGEGKLFITT